ncbi:MAG: hypothetical protein QF535_02570, partial [Anaerolineales bacterium]|nr:hypothetical protein [Anaerolineales bacterium]
MKNKGSILRASLLVITLFVATFAGFVDIADAADFASTVVSPGIAAEDTIIEISINVTNNDAVNNVTEVRIDGNGNFTDFACPNPLYGLVDDWDLTASGNNYCKYLRSLNSGIENGNTETFTINATTPSGSGNSSFEVRAYLANWQSTYPELEIDADGPVILMDEPLDNDWTDSLAFYIDTVSINDSSNIVGNCSVVFTDNDSVAHDLGEVEYAAGACDDEVTLPNGTAEGLGTLTVSIEDEWGHVGSNTTLFGYDTVAPTSSVLPMPTYTTDCDSVPIQISFDDNTGNTSINLDRIRVNVTNTDVWATYESNDPNFDGVINSDLCALGDGTLEFYAFGRDNAGNEESIPLSADTTTFMDTAAPDFNITIPSDGDWVNDGTFTVETTNITETGSGVVDYCEVVYQDANGNTTLGNITYDGSACSGPISISNDTANGMGTLYVYVYDLAGNKGGGRSAGDDFIDLGFDDDAPYVFIDVEPSGPQDPGALAYNATVCDAGIGINDSTIAVRINENGIQGWVEQTPVLTPNATCYFVSGAIEANLRKTGESYSIDLYVSDNSSNSDT